MNSICSLRLRLADPNRHFFGEAKRPGDVSVCVCPLRTCEFWLRRKAKQKKEIKFFDFFPKTDLLRFGKTELLITGVAEPRRLQI